MNWCIYFLKSKIRRWYYIGSTNRLNERVVEHNLGKVASTKPYRPLKLVYSLDFLTEKEARNYERKLKDMRTEKEKIIKLIESK